MKFKAGQLIRRMRYSDEDIGPNGVSIILDIVRNIHGFINNTTLYYRILFDEDLNPQELGMDPFWICHIIDEHFEAVK